MATVDDYVIETLMRDLVGHDRKPASFLVYLWLTAEQARHKGEIEISYRELAESVGISKSSAQLAVGWLVTRRLLVRSRRSITSTPHYSVRTPWREIAQRLQGRR